MSKLWITTSWLCVHKWQLFTAGHYYVSQTHSASVTSTCVDTKCPFMCCYSPTPTCISARLCTFVKQHSHPSLPPHSQQSRRPRWIHVSATVNNNTKRWQHSTWQLWRSTSFTPATLNLQPVKHSSKPRPAYLLRCMILAPRHPADDEEYDSASRWTAILRLSCDLCQDSSEKWFIMCLWQGPDDELSLSLSLHSLTYHMTRDTRAHRWVLRHIYITRVHHTAVYHHFTTPSKRRLAQCTPMRNQAATGQLANWWPAHATLSSSGQITANVQARSTQSAYHKQLELEQGHIS